MKGDEKRQNIAGHIVFILGYRDNGKNGNHYSKTRVV